MLEGGWLTGSVGWVRCRGGAGCNEMLQNASGWGELQWGTRSEVVWGRARWGWGGVGWSGGGWVLCGGPQ